MESTSEPSRIGVCAWSLRLERPEDLAAALARLELSICQLSLVPCVEESATWSDAPQILRDAGVRIASGMLAMVGEDYATLESIRRTGGVTADDRWQENLQRATLVADFAAANSIELVTFHAGFLPEDSDDPRRRTMLDRLSTIADIYAEREIDLGFETGQETADTLLELLAELDRPNVGVNFDPANMILYDMGDPVRALRKLADRVLQIHIKDAVPPEAPGEWGIEVPVGEGAVDWRLFFEAAAELPRNVDLIIEREAGESRETEIIGARNVIEQYLPGHND